MQIIILMMTNLCIREDTYIANRIKLAKMVILVILMLSRIQHKNEILQSTTGITCDGATCAWLQLYIMCMTPNKIHLQLSAGITCITQPAHTCNCVHKHENTLKIIIIRRDNL